MIAYIGFTLAATGSILGIIGAWYVSCKEREQQHKGYTLWLINSPMIVVSLLGIAFGYWEGLNALALSPMNVIYWYTAMRGWRNTRGEES